MTVTVFITAKGSPGVTTSVLACAAVWPSHREVVVVEADPAGGDLVVRFHQPTGDGVAESPSTVQLAAAARPALSRTMLLAHLQTLPGPGGVRALVAPPGAQAASTALTTLIGAGLVDVLGGLEELDVIVDAGHLDSRSPARPLLVAADRVLVVVASTLASVWHTTELVASLRAGGIDSELVVIGDRPYPPGEVAAALEADEAGVLPVDEPAAAALAGEARSAKTLARSRLARAAGELTAHLAPPPATVRAEPVLSSLPPPPAPSAGSGTVGLAALVHRDVEVWR